MKNSLVSKGVLLNKASVAQLKKGFSNYNLSYLMQENEKGLHAFSN